ncbi:MAG: 2-phospho-L-lactate transferase CofD family protein [Actinomycetia bacterium]|nr:2-phospho-L-lactate transferase CofD family protein [Actinomycetes bacterium]
MARALRHVLDPGHLTVVVNVGDDTKRYGVYVAADPDTVLYTLAGVVGPDGWGRADDTRKAMESLAVMGFDTTFTLGDKDLALCLARTEMLEDGMPLSDVTAALQLGLGLDDVTILPSSNDFLRTFVQIEGGEWLGFQEYFVDRSHADAVHAVAYHGAHEATAAPGVVAAIQSCDTLMVAPSNPPLSIWPILAVGEIDAAVRQHPRRVAVSPLFSGAALKGPAAEVMSGVGLAAGTRGILEAYRGFIDHLFIDSADAPDIALGPEFDVAIHASDTLLSGSDEGATFAAQIIETVIA